MDMPAPPARAPGRSASELLEDLSDAFPGDKTTVGALIDQLDSRAHGVLLLILALPMCIPNVPGISFIFGVLMLAPALQLVFGSKRLWVPNRVRAWEVNCEDIRRTVRVTTPTLRRIEFLIRPRWSRLTRFPVTILIGLQTLLMALILIPPIPLANWGPGMTVAMTALALLQRDGLLMLLTIPAAIASVGSVYIGLRLGVAAINGAVDWVQGLIAAFN